MEKEELFIPKTKYKGLKICLAILLIVGLLVGGYFLYQYKFNNTKTIINNYLEESKEKIMELFQGTNSDKNDIYKIDGHAKLDTNITDSEDLNILKDIELQFNGELDVNELIGNFTFNTKYKNEKLIDFKTYNEKNSIYFLLDGIYDKYIKADSTITDEEIVTYDMPTLDINKEDTKTIIYSLIDSLKKEVNNLDIKKDNATITIDGKDINVINNYIELKDKEINNFIKNIFNNLKDDAKLMEFIGRITKQDAKLIIDSIVKSIDETELNGTYKICFYTDKGLFNKKMLSIRQTISVKEGNISFNTDRISDDEVAITISAMGLEYSVKLKMNDSVANISFNINIMGQYLNVILNMNYEPIKEVTKPNISNSVNINDLKEEEKEEISKKLSENTTLMELIKNINKINNKEV